MNRNRWIAVAAVLVVVVLGVVWMKSRGHKEAPKYRTATVERGDITATVSATGSVEPVLQVQVGSQVSGTLAKLYVDYNSHVRAGQVLAQLETSAFRARLAQAEASVARAQATLTNGQLALKRTIELQRGNFVAQADVDAAQATVGQQQADLKQAQAALQSAQVDLGHTTITSPIDGVVISRSIDVGQTVAASLQAPQLFVIANDLRQMQVETKIDEADIGRIQNGLPVEFTVDAYPDVTFEGAVSQVRLEPVVESNVVTYTTVISTRNDDLRLRPGMTANVVVKTATHTGVLKVPNAALRFKPAGASGPGGNGGGMRGMGGGAQGGGSPNGGFRRGFAALLSRVVPSAFAQEPPPGGPGAGDRRPADPFLQQVRERVQKGEITREQARELIRKHFEELGVAPPGGPGGPGGPPAGAPGEPGAGVGAPPAGRGAETGMRPRDAMGARPGAPPAGGANGAWRRGGARDSSARGGNGAWGAGRNGHALPDGFRPGAVYVLRDKQPARVHVLSGITDGQFTEVRTDSLKEGDTVIVGLDVSAQSKGSLTPPPGMGGPQFGRPGGGGRR